MYPARQNEFTIPAFFKGGSSSLKSVERPVWLVGMFALVRDCSLLFVAFAVSFAVSRGIEEQIWFGLFVKVRLVLIKFGLLCPLCIVPSRRLLLVLLHGLLHPCF